VLLLLSSIVAYDTQRFRWRGRGRWKQQRRRSRALERVDDLQRSPSYHHRRSDGGTPDLDVSFGSHKNLFVISLALPREYNIVPVTIKPTLHKSVSRRYRTFVFYLLNEYCAAASRLQPRHVLYILCKRSTHFPRAENSFVAIFFPYFATDIVAVLDVWRERS